MDVREKCHYWHSLSSSGYRICWRNPRDVRPLVVGRICMKSQAGLNAMQQVVELLAYEWLDVSQSED